MVSFIYEKSKLTRILRRVTTVTFQKSLDKSLQDEMILFNFILISKIKLIFRTEIQKVQKTKR